MPSGKQSKAKRRASAAPPPVRAKGVRARKASPRMLAIGGGIVAVAVVGVVLAIVLSGGKSSATGTLPTTGSLANALRGASDVNTLLAGIPQKGTTLGSAKAPVTLVEYIDLQCPFCREFETQVMPSLIKRYVRTGKLKLDARVLAFIGPDSLRGRNAMLAAGSQNKAFNYAQLLYANQGTENTGWLDDNMVTQAALSVPGLNPRLLVDERNSSSVKQLGAGFDDDARSAKVNATPTLFVARSGGPARRVPLQSPADSASVEQAIQTALGQ